MLSVIKMIVMTRGKKEEVIEKEGVLMRTTITMEAQSILIQEVAVQ